MEVELKILSGKGKFFIYLPVQVRKKINIKIGDPVKIIFNFNDEQLTFISKYNYNITVKKDLAKSLNLSKGDKVKIKIYKLNPSKKIQEPFINNKVDLAFFIPVKTKKGSHLHYEIFKRDSKEFIRIVAIHKRGSSSQVVFRRFVDPKILGSFLGQIQSEGTKTDFDKIEFCNKNFFEIRDFIYYINYFGISKNKITTKLDYHISFENKKQEIINEFINEIGLNIDYVSTSLKSRGGYGFKILIRNVALAEIFLNCLVRIREFINIGLEEIPLSFYEGYLCKILSGDGSFELTSKNRKKIQARLLISDGNLNYLRHYKILLQKFGFRPIIKEDFEYIRTMCNLELAIMLLEINAFENNPNKEKLLFFIKNNQIASTRGGGLSYLIKN